MHGKMSSQLVSLKWDGHHKTLVSVFEKLLVNSHVVDCTIAVEGQKLKAHQHILSAFSPFFELLFREEIENNPTLIVSGISYRDLRSLVYFMYHGELEVPEDRIQDLIDAAECLQIKGLGSIHKEDDSENVDDTKVFLNRSGIPLKQTGKGEHEASASVDPKESEEKNFNYSNDIQLENSVVISNRTSQTSPVQNLMSNSYVQNVDIVSNMSLMTAKSTLSAIEKDSLHLESEYVLKEEPGSDGDENVSQSMRDTRKQVHVFGNSEDLYENSVEETSVGVISTDSNVPNEKSVYKDLPMDCIDPAELISQLLCRGLTVSSVKKELSNVNVILGSESTEPVERAEETQIPFLRSEFHLKTEDETVLSMDNNLMSENEEFPENIPEGIGVNAISDMQMKVVCPEKKNDCSGAASRCISESPQELPAAFVKIQRIDETAVGVMPGLRAGVHPHVTPTPLSHTTPACDRDLPGPARRDVSNRSSSADTYRCRICSTTFINRWGLNGHMRSHSKDKPFRKGECSNGSVISTKLNEHQHNESGRMLNKCSLCDFKSAHRSSLSEHMRIHKELETYKCTECEYTSTHPWHLKRHQRIHNYKCTKCDYRTVKISNLKSHQRTHSGVKPYKCTECDYRSAQSSSLKTHQRIHSGEKPYKCTECDFRAYLSYNLKVHQRIHSGIKPYKCTECEYTSAYIQNLRKHRRTHKLNTYKCKECGYSAVQLIDLKEHQQIHSGVKP